MSYANTNPALNLRNVPNNQPVQNVPPPQGVAYQAAPQQVPPPAQQGFQPGSFGDQANYVAQQAGQYPQPANQVQGQYVQQSGNVQQPYPGNQTPGFSNPTPATGQVYQQAAGNQPGYQQIQGNNPQANQSGQYQAQGNYQNQPMTPGPNQANQYDQYGQLVQNQGVAQQGNQWNQGVQNQGVVQQGNQWNQGVQNQGVVQQGYQWNQGVQNQGVLPQQTGVQPQFQIHPQVYDAANRLLSNQPMSQLFQKILQLSQKLSVDLQGKLLEFDRNQNGVVSLEHFRKFWNDQIITVLKSHAEASQLTLIEQALDFNHDGWIHYREFLNKVRNADYQIGGQPLAVAMDDTRKKKIFKTICKAFQTSSFNIEARFKSFDRNNSGKISLANFKNALANVTKLKEEEKVMLADHYDERNDGNLSYINFLNEINQELRTREAGARVLEELKKHITAKKIDLDYEFKQICPSGTKVRRDDFHTFLTKQLAFIVNVNDLSIFLSAFPIDQHSLIDVEKLLKKLPKVSQAGPRPEDSIIKLKLAIRARNATVSSIFAQYDQNRDGALDIREMDVLLQAFGIKITNAQISELITVMGGKHHKVSQNDFEKKLDLASEAQLSRDVEKFFAHLHNYLENSKIPLHEFFKKFDINKSNQLSWREFNEAIVTVNLELSNMEITRVLGEIDTDRNNEISFDELNTKYLQVTEKLRRENRLVTASAHDLNRVTEQLKQFLNGKQLNMLFNLVVDRDTQRQAITVMDFQRGLAPLNLLPSDFKILTDLFDIQGRGFIQLEDLTPYTAAAGSGVLAHWAEHLFMQLKENANRRNQSLTDALSTFHTNGKMSRSEFSKAMTLLAMSASLHEIEKLFNENKSGDGNVHTDDFVRLIEGRPKKNEQNMIDKIAEGLKTTAQPLNRAFQADSNGWVYRMEFAEQINKMRITCTQEELFEFLCLLNEDNKRIPREFTAQKFKFEVLDAKISQAGVDKGPATVQPTPRQVELQMKKKLYIQMADFMLQSNTDLYQNYFRTHDQHNTRKVTDQQFIGILQQLTVNQTTFRTHLEELALDWNEGGTLVQYDPFINHMNDIVTAKRDAAPILLRIREQIAGTNLESIFRSKDPGNTGHMKTYDIEEILKSNRVIVTSEEFNLLLKFILKDFEGKMDYVELFRCINGATIYQTPQAPISNTGIIQGTPNTNTPNPGYISVTPNPNIPAPPGPGYNPGPSNLHFPDADHNADVPPLPPLYTEPSFNPVCQPQPAFPGVFRINQQELVGQVYDPNNPNNYKIGEMNVENSYVYPQHANVSPGRPRLNGRGAADWAFPYWNQITNFAQRNLRDLNELLKQFDYHKTGMITIPEFQNMLTSLEVNIATTKMNDLVVELDTLHDGNVDLDELFKRVKGEPKESPFRKIKADPNHWANLVFQRMKNYLDQNDIKMMDLFKQFDVKGNNTISRADFTRMINQSIKITITAQEIEQLVNILDFDGDGDISYVEFVNVIGSYHTSHVRKPSDQWNNPQTPGRLPGHAHWAEKYFQIIRDHLDKNNLTILDLFANFDINSDNAISNVEFQTGLEQMQAGMNLQETQRLLKELDKNNDGIISLTEFEAILGHELSFHKHANNIIIRMKGNIKEDPQRTIQLFDTSRTNTISQADFKQALVRMDYYITQEDQEFLAQFFDKQKNNRIFYPTFLSMMGESNVLQINRKIKEFCQQRGVNLESIFLNTDQYQDGCTSLYEMQRILEQQNIPLHPDEITKVMHENNLYRPSNDRISYRDLLERLELNTGYQQPTYPNQWDPYQQPIGPVHGKDPNSLPTQYRPEFQHPPGPMLNAAAVYQQIQDDLDRSGRNLYDEFRKVDYNRNEFIRREDFSQALSYAGLTLTVQQIDEIYFDCQRDRDGRINFRDFLEKLKPKGSVFQQVQEQVARSGVNLYGEFKKFDHLHDEFIHREDFVTALRLARITLTPQQIDEIYYDCRRYGDGRVSFRDFLSKIQSQGGIFQHIAEALSRTNVDIQSELYKFDTNRDGHLMKEHFSQILRSAGLNLNYQQVEEVYRGCQQDQRGNISIRDFLEKLKTSGSSSGGRFVIQIYEKIKQIVEGNNANLLENFRSYDRQNTGLFDKPNLDRALEQSNVKLTDQELEAVLADLDPAQRTKINYYQFSQKIGARAPLISAQDMNWASPLFNMIAMKLQQLRISAREHFQKYRIEGKTMATTDFINALQRLGMQADPRGNDIYRLAQKFKVIGQERVEFSDFEWALNKFGNASAYQPQTITYNPTTPQVRRLNAAELDHVHNCFDYLHKLMNIDHHSTHSIASKYSVDGYLTAASFARIIEIDCKIPKDQRNLDLMVSYLKDLDGKISIQRLIDAVSGARIGQIVGPGEQHQMPNPPYNPPGGIQSQRPCTERLVDFLRTQNITILNAFGKQGGMIETAYFERYLQAINYKLTRRDMDMLVRELSEGQNHVQLNKLKDSLERPQVGPNAGIPNPGPAPVQDWHPNRPQPGTPGRPDVSPGRQVVSPGRGPNKNLVQRSGTYNPGAVKLNDADNQEAMNALNYELTRKGLTVEEAFRRYDTDRDNSLSKQEFFHAFDNMQLNITQLQLNQIYNELDTNKDGTISINEFSRKLPGAQLNEEQKANRMSVSMSMEAELMQLFQHFDKNGDGVIDRDELNLVLRSYNMNMSHREQNDIFNAMDNNKDGKIQFAEFRDVMLNKLKKEILRKESGLSEMRQKFNEADYMKNGYLTKPELDRCLERMGSKLNDQELDALVHYADRDQDGRIDIDEFMYMMSGADQTILADAHASQAMFNLRRNRKLNPTDFLTLVAGTPGHFISSFTEQELQMKRILPAFNISPSIDHSGLKFKDVVYQGRQDKFNNVSFLQKRPVEKGGLIILTEATGISSIDPREAKTHQIIKRFLRISFFDQTSLEFVGNSTIIEADYNSGNQDIWQFPPQKGETKDLNSFYFVSNKQKKNQKLSLIFEFVVLLAKDPPVEMSCGYAQLPLVNLHKSTSQSIEVRGGSPNAPIDIDPKDIHAHRMGFSSTVKKMFNGVSQSLRFQFKKSRQLTAQEEDEIASLHHCTVIQKHGLQIAAVYREYSSATIAQISRGNFSVPEISDALMTQLPKIMNNPDLWIPLTHFWGQSQFTLLRKQGQEKNLEQLRELVTRLYVVYSSQEFGNDQVPSHSLSAGYPGDISTKRSGMVSTALNQGQSLDKYTAKPFDISEVMTSSMIDLSSSMSYQLLERTRTADMASRSQLGSLGMSVSTGFYK